jgi:hypothetical protein
MSLTDLRWPLPSTLGPLLLAAACSGSVAPPPAVVNRAALEAFGGDTACADLEQYIEDTAVLQMRTQLEGQRDYVPVWGWWGGWGGMWADGGVMMGGVAGAAAPDRASAPSAYTTTNNQVAGVDEADLVKNDGTRIFALAGGKLHAVRSWPPEATALQGSLAIEGWPTELFLDGTSQAVVFSSIYEWYPMSHAAGLRCLGMGCGYWNANTVKVTVVDVSDLTNLTVKREYYLPGQYNSARKVGASVRLVLSDGFNYPDGYQWGPSYDPGPGTIFRRLAYDKVIAENEALIRAQQLSDWLPPFAIKSGGARTSVPVTCSDFSKVNAPTRMGLVSVVTLDLAHDTIARNTILSEPGEIYASTKNLYVATRHWWWWPAPGQTDTTYLHKFDLSDPAAARYVASGSVEGYIVDQFSMDESDTGYFRVVTTAARRVPDTQNPANWWGRTELTNRLTVLGERAGALEVVGQSPELAPGERVTGSRILGNKGFVVTFRQVDPLFTFDLTDPAHPTLKGELTVPGFSTYLHPLDDTHLLTIGMYRSPNPTDWASSAIQLAIFDVADLAAPRQTFTQLVGTASSWSEAVGEHKAFNYFGARKLLAIPFADWSYASNGQFSWSAFTSDLRVYSVDAATGFTPRGALSVADQYQSSSGSGWGYTWSYFWQPTVRRSVMADDFVYAIGDSGLRVANVNSLGSPLASVTFPPALAP